MPFDLQDFRYAWRTLARSRSFVVIATLMLALGIGANTAIFSVVLTVLIRPLPYADSERVVWLSNRNPTLGVSGAFLNPADILDFREQSQSFERIAAWGTLPVNLYGAKSLERVEGIYVTPLQALDSRGVVFNVRPFDQFLAEAVAPRRFNLWLFSAFGFLAALLAAAGLYATMNFAVVQRQREIGIRVALGAQKSAVMRLIVGEGSVLAAVGLLIGFAASLALNQLMKSLLFAVSATDPLIYFLMATVVVTIALIASGIPARRATKIDPIQTLRSD